MATNASSHRFVMLGGKGAGKTSLISQFFIQRFDEDYDPTIMDLHRREALIDGHSSTIYILDTSGDDLRSVLSNREIVQVQGSLLVYSITSRSSFSDLSTLSREIQQIRRSPRGSYPVPIMLIGNKKDLDGKREVSAQDGRALADELGCKFVETSAKDYQAVKGVFHDSIKMLNGDWVETSAKGYQAVEGVFHDPIEMLNDNCDRKSIWDYASTDDRWPVATTHSLSTQFAVVFLQSVYLPDATLADLFEYDVQGALRLTVKLYLTDKHCFWHFPQPGCSVELQTMRVAEQTGAHNNMEEAMGVKLSIFPALYMSKTSKDPEHTCERIEGADTIVLQALGDYKLVAKGLVLV